MKNKNNLIKSFSNVAFANLITKPLWVLLFIYAARVLGAEQFGVYTYAISIVIIASILIDFGFDYLAIRDISQDNGKLTSKYSEVIFSRIIFSGIILSAILGYAIVFNTISSFQFITIIILLFFQISTILNQFLKAIVSAFQNFNLYSKMLIWDKGLLIVFGFISLQLSTSLNNFLISIVVANIISTVIFTLILKKKYHLKFILPEISALRQLLKSSLPLLTMNIFIMAYFRIDVILLEYLVNDKSTVGVYGTIHRIIEMYFLLPTIIMSTAFPIISKYYSSNKNFVIELVNRILYSITALTLPVAIVISFNAFAINKFIFGSEYIEGYLGLKYIIWTILPLGFNYVLGHLLISINKQVYCAVSIAVASTINIILNILLIPSLSFVGTSIAMLSTEVVIFSLYMFFTLKFFAKIDLKKLLVKVFLILTITFVVYWIVSSSIEYNSYLYISLFICLTLLLVFIFKIIIIEDIKKLFFQFVDRKTIIDN